MTGTDQPRHDISPDRIAEFRAREAERYRAARRKTEAAIGAGIPGYFGGVPMHWMRDWPMPFPILVDKARGATITDIDGNRLDDFCLGDTGSMFGHSPLAGRPRRSAARPSAASPTCCRRRRARVGALLEKTVRPARLAGRDDGDATPTALRCSVARAVTNRPKILVFNGCYHGAVEDTFVRLKDGKPINRPGLAGEVPRPTPKPRVSSNSTTSTRSSMSSARATSPAS